ncbi:MAG: small ribosomal subunit Rsm22 family protein [Termitinemataceae bacterium]|nr:MAG: small ribosomal subunit Rsm22 family protein [Termitinemataceae bacterium]
MNSLTDFLDALLESIEKTYPLSAKHLSALPKNIEALSALLTTDRGARSADYLSQASFMHAYLRYFLPWNVFRLCRLFDVLKLSEHINEHNLIKSKTGKNITLIDLGAGPLSVLFALYFLGESLHQTEINIFCVDRNLKIMEAGKKIFLNLSGGKTKWKINLIKSEIGKKLLLPKADFVSAVNVCNEFFWNINQADISSLSISAKKFKNHLSSFAAPDAFIFVAEPGIPRCAQFLSLLRSAFIERDTILSPCTHELFCPQHGGKRGAKWCHFAFSVPDVPKKLLSLSRDAKLSKERIAISFLLVQSGRKADSSGTGGSGSKGLRVRITSDPFKTGYTKNGIALSGRYGCSPYGLVLVCGTQQQIASIENGKCISVANIDLKQKDKKSGALKVLLS